MAHVINLVNQLPKGVIYEMSNWIEELLRFRNEEYYEAHKKPAAPRKSKQAVPDLSDDEFWSKGESTT